MAGSSRAYSESWHRVAHLRLALRSSVQVRKQLFRGETWYLLQDPFKNRFFRLSRAAYAFVARLQPARSVDEAWTLCVDRDPEQAPGQGEVIRLLAQLYHADLLYCDLPIDSLQLFKRYQKRRSSEQRSKLLNLMFLRIPLFDPSPVLKRFSATAQLLTSRASVFVWLLLLAWAGKSLLENGDQLLVEARQLLAIDNLILLYAGLILVKSLHELGHTLVCNRFNGEVHTLGIMLIVFAPVPYMDATASWAFRARRERILVACAGMMFEFFAAACAALVWAATSAGWVHSLALNMLIVASISTLVFNANPLMRYDGYYILSDLLNMPNLQARAQSQLKYFGQRYLFALRQGVDPASNRREAFYLSGYGLLSSLYRLLVYTSIVLFVADRYFLVGFLLALLCVLNWVVLPIGKLLKYVLSAPELEPVRLRSIGIGLLLVLLSTLIVTQLPVPRQIRIPGVIHALGSYDLNSETDGFLSEILIADGAHVSQGQVLAKMDNPYLRIDIRQLDAQRQEILLLLQQDRVQNSDQTRKSLRQRLVSLDNSLSDLRQRAAALTIIARVDGVWAAPLLAARRDSWILRGEQLGRIVTRGTYEFTAVLVQENAASLFAQADSTDSSSLKLRGSEFHSLKLATLAIVPFEQTALPSAVLGWQAGGTIPTRVDDRRGLVALEPFFQVKARLSPQHGVKVVDGQSGIMRIRLPAQPMLQQALRKLRQFIQKRYQT
jgi:putative peptide zinc metalloprotease protein